MHTVIFLPKIHPILLSRLWKCLFHKISGIKKNTFKNAIVLNSFVFTIEDLHEIAFE
tara:strand:- start:557 stop:727 length:171 start_codon:yes stop_codon:yes gene_type:complete